MSRVGLTLRAHPSESLPSESAHVRGATNHLRHRARGARPAGTSPIPRGHFNESINQSALIPALSSGTALTLTSLGRRAPITRPPRRTKTFNYQTTDQLPHPSKSLRVGPTANSSDATSLFITAFCLLGEVCSSVKALVVIATQNFHGSSVHRRRVRQIYVVKMIGNCLRRLWLLSRWRQNLKKYVFPLSISVAFSAALLMFSSAHLEELARVFSLPHGTD